MRILVTLFLFVLVTSCEKEESLLPRGWGDVVIVIDGELLNFIGKSSDGLLVEGSKDVNFGHFNESEFLRRTISIHSMPSSEGLHHLRPLEFGSMGVAPISLLTSMHTYLDDGDVTDESFYLNASDDFDDFIEVTSISSSSISGKFQASFTNTLDTGAAPQVVPPRVVEIPSFDFTIPILEKF
ncbi:MAG: hypothetical protein AB8F78_09580 [Saprospiraceae bacterium]